MGTSTGFSLSCGPQWSEAKSAARDSVDSPGVDSKVKQALKTHLTALKRESSSYPSGGTGGGGGQGASGGTGGRDGGGGGGRRRGGRGLQASRSVASGLGGFIHDAQTNGLKQALTSRGFGHLLNQSVSDVVQGILASLSENASYIEESDALAAAGAVLDELQADCQSVDEFEERLNELVDTEKLSRMFEEFFRRVLIEDFMRRHWTQLQKKYPNGKIDGFRARIEELLLDRLKYEHNWKDLSQVDWSSQESEALIEQIQQETFEFCMEVDL